VEYPFGLYDPMQELARSFWQARRVTRLRQTNQGTSHLGGRIDALSAINADAQTFDDGLELPGGQHAQHLLEPEGTGAASLGLWTLT
jgi:hypothetical protein